MAQRQALGIDINEFARTGGINYELVKQHFQRGEYDFLIIKAGLGLTRSPILDEQRENCERFQIPFLTYHLPDPREDLRLQAHRYAEWVGTSEPAYMVDVEKPARDAQPRTRMQILEYLDEFAGLIQQDPILYSRANLLKEIGFINDARDFRLWIAQYPFDISKLPAVETQYRYFHDFTRDYGNMLPPAIHRTGLADRVILWQFSEKGNGPYYIYNRRTAHPVHKQGMKQADLNISIQDRNTFMQSIFGSAPANLEHENEIAPAGQSVEPTYPGITNQDMINLIYRAAAPFTDDPWADFIVRAHLEHLATPITNRDLPYNGPRIEDIPSWTSAEKEAVLARINAPQAPAPTGEPTYPSMTNQDMVNLIFRAARPFTDDPWRNWVMRARLESLAVPSGNRRKPYTGPKVENLPNLTEAEKAALLALVEGQG